MGNHQMQSHSEKPQTNGNCYQAVTRNIEVQVEPAYLEDQSDPQQMRFVWAYTIKIINSGDQTVQLKDRTWIITDGTGHTEKVHGPGVVGEQPILNPGDSFQYTSGCPLSTDSGFMTGHYTMLSESGERFEIDIPAFALDLPGSRRTIN